MKKFVTQQATLVPENRRKVEHVYTVKVPKKRGRKKSLINARRFMFLRKLAHGRLEFMEGVGHGIELL